MSKTYTASNDHGTVTMTIVDKSAKVAATGDFEDLAEVARLINECTAQYQADHQERSDAHSEAE